MNSPKLSYKRKILATTTYNFRKTLVDKVLAFTLVAGSLLLLFFGSHYCSDSYKVVNSSALLTFLLASYILSQVSEESLLIVSPIGLQTVTSYVIGLRSSQYIPWSSLKDVAINEAVQGFRIVRYLAALSEDETGNTLLHPLLLHSKLRLCELKEIYNRIQDILQK